MRAWSESLGWIDVDVIPSSAFTGRSAIYTLVGEIDQRENPWQREAVNPGDLLSANDVRGKGAADLEFGNQRLRLPKVACTRCKRPLSADQIRHGRRQCVKGVGCRRGDRRVQMAASSPCRGCGQEFPVLNLTAKLRLCPTCKSGGRRAVRDAA